MTTHVISTNSSIGLNTTADKDTWILQAGVTVSVANDNVFFGGDHFSGNIFNIDGTAIATGPKSAILMYGNNTVINIGNTGSVIADMVGLWMEHYHVQPKELATVNNDGHVFGGHIGVNFEGPDNILNNGGTIESDGTGVQVNGGYDILNTGTISADIGIAISSSDYYRMASSNVVTNEGTLIGTTFAFAGSQSGETFVNRGTVIGDIGLGMGEDVYVSDGGTVDGAVIGGNGYDTYYLDGTPVDIREGKGYGADRIIASVTLSLSDYQYIEELVLAGNTAIDGTGSAANNIITGNTKANYLRGLGGDDILRGGSGADTLEGGTGDDRIYSEKGNDTVTGGTGVDTFVFSSGDGVNVVTDFEAGSGAHDILDIRAISIITDYADLVQNHMAQSGNDVVISYGVNSITIKNADIADLRSGDFMI